MWICIVMLCGVPRSYSCICFRQELFGDTSRPKRNLRTAVAFVLGGMSVAVRFTSLAAFITIGILLALQISTHARRIMFLAIPCALWGLVGIGLSLIVDRCFYGFWTVPFLGSLHFNVILGEWRDIVM